MAGFMATAATLFRIDKVNLSAVVVINMARAGSFADLFHFHSSTDNSLSLLSFVNKKSIYEKICLEEKKLIKFVSFVGLDSSSNGQSFILRILSLLLLLLL